MSLKSIDTSTNPNGITIWLNGRDRVEGTSDAAGAITPGMIVQATSTGTFIKDNASGKAAGWVPEHVSEPFPNNPENLLADYLVGQRIMANRNPGDKFMGLIASGQNIAYGARLKTNAGKLVAFVEGTDADNLWVATLRIVGGTGGALAADTRLPCVWGKVS